MRLDQFRKVGGYCEAMPCNEDAEIDHRLVRAGGRIWLEPAAALSYFPRRTPKALWRQYFRYGIGRARMLRRHRARPALRQIVPLAVPLSAGLAVFAWVHWSLALPFLAWAVLVIVAGLAIGARRGGGWTLLSGVAAGIMQFAWGCGFIFEWLRPAGLAAPRYGLAEPS
jgi:succinoglycan biosynthesis protein ExoA